MNILNILLDEVEALRKRVPHSSTRDVVEMLVWTESSAHFRPSPHHIPRCGGYMLCAFSLRYVYAPITRTVAKRRYFSLYPVGSLLVSSVIFKF